MRTDLDVARLPALDGLRGLAALTVVLHHFYLTLPPSLQPQVRALVDWPGLRPIVIGRPAVILFFVLSGFVLTRSLKFHAKRSPVDFILRRCLRIYPPFVAAIAISALLLAVVSPVRPTSLSEWFNAQWTGYPDKEMVLRQVVSQAVARDTSLDHPIWSLVHEFRFSLALPFIFLAASAWGLRRVCLAATLTSLTGMVAVRQSAVDPLQNYGGFHFVGDSLASSIALTAYLSIYFVGGMALAMLFEKMRPGVVALPNWLLAAGGLACVVFLSDWSELAAGTGALGAVFLTAALPNACRFFVEWPLAWLGKISYSLYLIHIPVLLAVGHAAPKGTPVLAIFAVAFVASLALAQLIYLCVEKPSIACARRLPRVSLRRVGGVVSETRPT